MPAVLKPGYVYEAAPDVRMPVDASVPSIVYETVPVGTAPVPVTAAAMVTCEPADVVEGSTTTRTLGMRVCTEELTVTGNVALAGLYFVSPL